MPNELSRTRVASGILRNEPSVRLAVRAGLRNEPTRTIFLHNHQRIQGFVESALVRSLISQKQGQALLVDAFSGKTFVLKAKRTLSEPPGLSELMDQQLFSGAGGLVLGEQASEERIEIGAILSGDDELRGGETVLQRITRRSQFPGGCPRAGGMLGVNAVDVSSIDLGSGG